MHKNYAKIKKSWLVNGKINTLDNLQLKLFHSL